MILNIRSAVIYRRSLLSYHHPTGENEYVRNKNHILLLFFWTDAASKNTTVYLSNFLSITAFSSLHFSLGFQAYVSRFILDSDILFLKVSKNLFQQILIIIKVNNNNNVFVTSIETLVRSLESLRVISDRLRSPMIIEQFARRLLSG